jgi:hypothetical protein
MYVLSLLIVAGACVASTWVSHRTARAAIDAAQDAQLDTAETTKIIAAALEQAVRGAVHSLMAPPPYQPAAGEPQQQVHDMPTYESRDDQWTADEFVDPTDFTLPMGERPNVMSGIDTGVAGLQTPANPLLER